MEQNQENSEFSFKTNAMDKRSSGFSSVVDNNLDGPK